MQQVIVTTPEELEGIIHRCLSSLTSAPSPEQTSETTDAKYLHSIRELAEFLGCSVVTAQKLKNSGRIRYKQFGRKVMFNSAEVLEDLNTNRKRNNISNNI